MLHRYTQADVCTIGYAYVSYVKVLKRRKKYFNTLESVCEAINQFFIKLIETGKY